MVVRKKIQVVMFYYFQGHYKITYFSKLLEKTEAFTSEKLKKHRT